MRALGHCCPSCPSKGASSATHWSAAGAPGTAQPRQHSEWKRSPDTRTFVSPTGRAGVTEHRTGPVILNSTFRPEFTPKYSAYAGGDAPARRRVKSWAEPLILLGSGAPCQSVAEISGQYQLNDLDNCPGILARNGGLTPPRLVACPRLMTHLGVRDASYPPHQCRWPLESQQNIGHFLILC